MASLTLENFLRSKHYRVPRGLKLNSVSQGLLKALHDTKMGRMEEPDLARRLRTPWEIKKGEFGTVCGNVQDMVEQCKTIMADDPWEKDLCEEVIQKCKEMLRIANNPVGWKVKFLDFHIDARHDIYDMVIGHAATLVHQCSNATHRYVTCPTGSCLAAPEGDICKSDLKEMLALAQTCKQIRDELLSLAYKKKVLYFSCTCALGLCLSKNQLVLNNVQSVKLHLRGPETCKAITLLNCYPNLKRLEITVSKYSTFYMTKQDFDKLPSHQQDRVTYEGDVPLKEARGVSELLAVRGIESIQVTHACVRESMPSMSDVEVKEFEAFLKERLLKVDVTELTASLDKL